MGSEMGMRTGWGPPWVAGLARISPQVGIRDSGTQGQGGLGTSGLKPIPAFSRPLQGWARIGREIESHFSAGNVDRELQEYLQIGSAPPPGPAHLCRVGTL